MNQRRAARARRLAARYPVSREPLLFYAELMDLPPGLEPLRSFVAAKGPALLAEFARALSTAEPPLEDPASPAGFFARVMRQQRGEFTPPAQAAPNLCPHCGNPPQAGCLRPEGDGTALSLVCSLCGNEWPFPRGHCPGCDSDKLAFYAAEGFDHIQVQACDACRRYLHLINLAKDPEAIPEVDELAALPLDVWAREQGYVKLYPNLAGI